MELIRTRESYQNFFASRGGVSFLSFFKFYINLHTTLVVQVEQSVCVFIRQYFLTKRPLA